MSQPHVGQCGLDAASSSGQPEHLRVVCHLRLPCDVDRAAGGRRPVSG